MRYERLSGDELAAAVKRCPVAYVPAGIVEWHGEQSACGLDGLKAESLCRMAGSMFGGVVFPHVWPGPDASTPFDPIRYPRGTVTIDKGIYLQAVEDLLRRIEGLGFEVGVYLSGHYPGVVADLAEAYTKRGGMKVISISENMAVRGMPSGDHAAAWETAVLMALRPGCVDLSRLPPLPKGLEHAGQVIPPKWTFRQRSEFYGIYGSDPRVWANVHFGRRGSEAVLDGLAHMVGEALGDPRYGRDRPTITWPDDVLDEPEVRYAFLKPADWMRRFEQAPIVYVPLVAAGDAEEDLTKTGVALARKHGGLVFPPVHYGPPSEGRGVALAKDVYIQIAGEVIADLADMDFRVVALMPSGRLAPAVTDALVRSINKNDQVRAVVCKAGQAAAASASIDKALREMIPHNPEEHTLRGPWRINGEREVADLGEAVYGPAGQRVYEHLFELKADEADGAIVLDLGNVANLCEVSINDGPALRDHWPPYHFVLTGRVRPGENRIKVVVRHEAQSTLDRFYYRVGPPELRGPVKLLTWEP